MYNINRCTIRIIRENSTKFPFNGYLYKVQKKIVARGRGLAVAERKFKILSWLILTMPSHRDE